MLALHELQAAMVRALLGGDAAAAAAEVQGDGLAPESRLDIYRHHVIDTLTAVLEAAFPVVCRLVDRRFFAYAADSYIRREPPAGPCLFEYGATLPDFLAAFPACAGLPYLADVARLEWAMHRAAHAEDAAPLAPAQLAAVPAEDVPRLTFRLQPSLFLLGSRWPVDRIWKANRATAEEPDPVDLSAGPAYLEVRSDGVGVTVRAVDAARHTFRSALAAGRCLERAAAEAATVDARFDLPAALHDLLSEQVLVELAIESITDD